MKIVTTPMCQEILNLAGITDFLLVKNGDYNGAEVAVVLSETKIPENTSTKFIKLKLNTYSQIEESIKLVSDMLGSKPLQKNLYKKLPNAQNEIKVKVYSNFLMELAEDVGFTIVTDDSYDFLIYPDYLKDELKEEVYGADDRAVEIPSHGNAPQNPVERVKMRYEILRNRLCMKH